MKNQSLLLMAVAGGCGLVAMFGVKQVIDSRPQQEQEQKVKVLCASTDIQVGTPLDELNTQFVEVNLEAVPEGAVLDLKEIEERALRVPATVGDWITKGKLTERGEFGYVGQIPPGMRVKTIPVDATQIHSGMLQPGNRIDITLSYSDRGIGRTIQKTRTVLEYVEVFAVDKHVYGTGEEEGVTSAKNISLLVTPEQSALLDLCLNKGKLSTTLRSNADKSETGTLELTDEAFGNALAGTDTLNDSMMEYRDDLNKSNSLDLNDASEYTIAGQLEDELNEPDGSEPLIQLAEATEIDPKNVWIMEIHEGPNVRLESITILDPEQTDEQPETDNQEEQTEQTNWDLSTEAPDSSSFWDFLRAKSEEVLMPGAETVEL